MKTNHNGFSPYRFSVLTTALLTAFCGTSNATEAEQTLRQKALSNPEFVRLIQKLNKSYQQNMVAQVAGTQSTDVTDVSGQTDISQSTISQQDSGKAVLETTDPDAADPTAQNSRFAVDEELIVTVKVKNFLLGEVFVIKTELGFKVSFAGLMQALQFAIATDLNKSKAQGWFIRETNSFTFSWQKDSAESKGQVKLNDSVIDVAAKSMLVTEGDIYVELADVQQWFNLTLEVDERELELLVRSDTPLPVEEKAARNTKQVGTNKNQASVLPERSGGYTAFSAPVVDAQLNVRKNAARTQTTASVLGSQDMAFVNSQYYLSANEDGVRAGRLTFEKESANQDLLGPLQLSKVSFGDITPVNIGFAPTSALSRGVSFTNKQRSVNLLARTVNLQGDIQEGWDVELYRNRLLIDRLGNVSSGRYEFNDTELLYGPNEFEIVMYGPQGQIEVRKEFYDINELNAKPGDVLFDASLVQLNETLIQNKTITNESQLGNYFSGTASVGIFDWWAADAGIGALRSSSTEDTNTITLGNSFQLGSLATLGLGYQRDSLDRSSPTLDIRTRILGFSLRGSYEKVNDPTNSLGIFDQSERYRAQMSGQLFDKSALPLSIQNTWDSYNLPTGERLSTFKNNIGTSFGRFSVGNQLTLTNDSNLAVGLAELQKYLDEQQLENPEQQLTRPPESFFEQDRDMYGSAQIRTSIGSAYVGLGMDYSLKPEYRADQYSLNVFTPVTESIQSRLGVGYVTENKDYSGQLSFTYSHDNFMLTFDSSYFNKQWNAGLNARFSFGYEPTTGQYLLSGRKQSDKGAVAVKVYQDKNANLKHDANEPLIDGAKILAKQSRREALTNQDGVAMVKALPAMRKTDVVIDLNSLEDPRMIGMIEGYSVTPRQGFINVLEIPVVVGGEIEGSISAKNTFDVVEPLAYIPVELHDLSGKTVATTQSEFDGYYLFSGVKPGRYIVRLNQQALKTKSVRANTPVYLKYRGDGELISGTDFILESKEKSAGYAVLLGEFAALPTLKSYWYIIKKYGSKVAIDRPFYMQNQDTSKYELFAGFYQTEQRAEQRCSSLNEQKVQCSVRAYNFDL